MVKLHVFRTTLLLLTVLAYGLFVASPQKLAPEWSDRYTAATHLLQRQSEMLLQQLSEQTCNTVEAFYNSLESIVPEPLKWWAEILLAQEADSL